MKVDWVTLSAQIINFLILLALLKKFLFDRIVKVMDEREQRISDRLKEADSKKEEADEELQKYQSKNDDLDQKHDELMEKAQKESEQEKKELIKRAREDVDSMRSKWRRSIEREKDSFLGDLRRKAGEQVYSVARKVLKDLSDYKIEEQIISVFLDRLSDLESDDRDEIAGLIRESNNNVIVKTSFELENDLQKKIESSIREIIYAEAAIDFNTSKEFICGIEMRVNGKKVVWNIDSYLHALEERFQDLIEKEVDKTESKDKKEKNE